ncbi:dihydrodipicolinate synthase family protein (plasmid) [Rhizobium sp. RCAM05350]|uniref:dihydrodipicolinate synthase family protein n=1 Tax=Rhizobium sp. RCAM05350 TaxID=2895568 RepID=UPI0020767036|nr:dihydrodipicolinate synthase family protein [Rhizobium sp. RCAM05350]URK89537.1 dihydrodipicolinate synthase family protein [Rhizobium sp. RCAM05350]
MDLQLPDESGRLSPYRLTGTPIQTAEFSRDYNRVVFPPPMSSPIPGPQTIRQGPASVDWAATMAFRRHLHDLGLGIAEGMDTTQRGMGLDWPGALELIRRTRQEVPDALVFNGAGTDHLSPYDARSLDDVRRAYREQIEAIQKIGGRIILMASRALTKLAKGPQDYIDIYRDALSACDEPVVLHWLGDMFDPALAGYWGSTSFEEAMETALTVIGENISKVDGIKISLLDKDKEVVMRRRLPEGVKMYTGDDFNYPELIEGDPEGYSHALLGIFDPLAPAAAFALSRLKAGDAKGFRAVLDPTVPLARLIFRAPTQYYKTGVVFLAWLNGFQDHFIMLNGAQAMRPLPYFTEVFKLADQCGLLRDGDLAIGRMKKMLAFYGA